MPKLHWPARAVLAALLLTLYGGQSLAQQTGDEALRERVLAAIKSGQQVLVSEQHRDGSWEAPPFANHGVGVTSLVTLALLSSGLPPDHDSMKRAIAYLKRPEVDPVQTYDVALCIMALAASEDRAVAGKVARLAAKLESGQLRGPNGGSWGYGGGERTGWRDNSNTQFAILGLREAAYLGVPVDLEVWRQVQEHFLHTQSGPVNSPHGAGWGYTGSENPIGSMTVAGIASLSITSALLADDSDVSADGQIDCCGQRPDPVEDAIEAGVLWLSRRFNVRSNPGTSQWPLYYVYGLERAGRFTGHRFFGDHDWYREGAQLLVDTQSVREHVWVGQNEPALVGTSYALLFLAKGLSPVVINKLKFGHRDPRSGEVLGRDWNRHSRDVANLVDFTSGLPKWPRLLTWQVVDLRTAANGEGVAALLQSPVQFMSGTESPDSIQGRELELLRSYLAQGGFLFAVQNCESSDFDRGFRDLVRRLFDGQQELVKLPPTHDVYRSEYVFPQDVALPELWGVEFGCRTAIIYAPYDHACRWNKWVKHDPPGRPLAVKTQIEKSLRLGVNVLAYATGGELLDKLQTRKVLAASEEQRSSRGRLMIARLRHTGGWDTAPNALRHLQGALDALDINVAADTPNLAANDPALFDYPLLYIHGRKNFQFSEEERAELRKFLLNGGFLFADACCGSPQFDDSFRKLIEQIFERPLERIPSDHEIFNLKLGYDIRKVTRRMPATNPTASSLQTEVSVGEPILEGLKVGDRYVVVYSKYDLSCALERQSTSACAGYPTEDAVRIGVNLVLYGLVQ